MYQFAVVALLALATVKVVDFLIDNIPLIERFRSLPIARSAVLAGRTMA